MDQFYTEETSGALAIGESARGRAIGALTRGLVVAAGASALLSIFLLPDFIGRYAEREPVAGLYALSLAGLAGLAGFALGLSRWLRRERWLLDARAGALVLERGLGRGEPMSEAIDLEHVSAIEWARRPWFRASTLDAVMSDGHTIPLLSAPAFDASLDRVVDAVEEYCRRERVGLHVRARSA